MRDHPPPPRLHKLFVSSAAEHLSAGRSAWPGCDLWAPNVHRSAPIIQPMDNRANRKIKGTFPFDLIPHATLPIRWYSDRTDSEARQTVRRRRNPRRLAHKSAHGSQLSLTEWMHLVTWPCPQYISIFQSTPLALFFFFWWMSSDLIGMFVMFGCVSWPAPQNRRPVCTGLEIQKCTIKNIYFFFVCNKVNDTNESFSTRDTKSSVPGHTSLKRDHRV